MPKQIAKKMTKNAKIALKNAKESAKKNHKVPIEAKQVLKKRYFHSIGATNTSRDSVSPCKWDFR